ncbi:hypothetical protein SAZ10_16555 [Mesorhizobium sp. BAC0120]|uniref:hypothetical protein n=1 Tax=Mesorhizobium sp. BAC0120 TaxID=3090670 RepID=UPI00298CB0F0|nr:hypothetical protein [Mesorhizobium sp. BAC0120]MDW6023365.1 hypothetical protein [Mesorhizobium sp. BAC0120]
MGDTNCPPPEKLVPDEKERQQVEKEIEQFIESHFEASPAELGAISVFKDPGNDSNGRNQSQQAFKTWLQTFSGVPLNQDRLSKPFSVPDIASRRPGLQVNEFYEIKPDTHNGQRDCGQKVVEVGSFLHEVGAVFVPGLDYEIAPNKEFVFNRQVGAVEVEIRLTWRVAAPGNIWYKVCLFVKKKQEVREPSADNKAFLFALILLAVAIALAVGLKGGRGMRFPGQIPAPSAA